MIRIVIVILSAMSLQYAKGQDIPSVTEQQLENLAAAEESETEDDAYIQQLEQFRKNPVNLNTADAAALKELRLLSGLQIDNLLAYRQLLGNLVNIYELQAIPSWDIGMIHKLLPFITVAVFLPVDEEFSRRIRYGEHSLLFRASRMIEKSDQPIGEGSPWKLFFRYRYVYKNLLQFGIAGDKDAGEQFFKGAQRSGFDFYSFHLFARQIGHIKVLALGDFTASFGQGLIQWQGLAFKKSTEVMGIKRQSDVLRPYSSAGEYNFLRGAGITLKKEKLEATLLASLRALSGNVSLDTLSGKRSISSFLTSGYHRTPGEINDRNNTRQLTLGGNLRYITDRSHFGFNGIYYAYSMPVQKRNEPYNLYAINGNNWYNASADYGYTCKNIHFFGEIAADRNFNKAMVTGVLVSADPAVDLSLLYRSISEKYQAVNGNAFTENTAPSNENGLYAGIAIRPVQSLRLDMYADVYHFPWLRHLADGPGYGREMMLQLTYTPGKQAEVYTRYRSENKPGNIPNNLTPVNYIDQLPKQSWRTHISCRINSVIAVRNRVEIAWYDRRGDNRENGFLALLDIIYKPVLRPYAGAFRIQYFETDGYNARINVYENDVLYSYSVPAFSGKGYRYYLTVNYDLTKKLSGWLRWARTTYPGETGTGPGSAKITGSEMKFQLRYLF